MPPCPTMHDVANSDTTGSDLSGDDPDSEAIFC